MKDIDKHYKELSKDLHPDKFRARAIRGQQQGIFNIGDIDKAVSESKDMFQQLKKAHEYLTNPLTKIIYDEFGVTGLALYEKNKTAFTELQEESRIFKEPIINLNLRG